MSALLQDIDVCFHLASYGMSGADQLNQGRVTEVNVGGTRNVIQGCQEHGVSVLVYVSTYNVVFAGQEIVNGNETLPYVEDGAHVDHYSRTKTIAEQLVLEANSLHQGLRTASIRPAAIYG